MSSIYNFSETNKSTFLSGQVLNSTMLFDIYIYIIFYPWGFKHCSGLIQNYCFMIWDPKCYQFRIIEYEPSVFESFLFVWVWNIKQGLLKMLYHIFSFDYFSTIFMAFESDAEIGNFIEERKVLCHQLFLGSTNLFCIRCASIKLLLL